MERKIILALASLSTILFASFTLIAPMPPTSALIIENHRYIVMRGFVKGCSDINRGAEPNATLDWKTPIQTRPPDLMPTQMSQNITFSEPWYYNDTYKWIVNLTVPYESYTGLEHIWYDKPSTLWYKMVVAMEEDGHGWIFLNATGDVDSYTENKDTGVWWISPSPKAGTKAADTGDAAGLPVVGSDGVAGTADDGFGDGTPDPPGSSIVFLPSKMRVDYWTGSAWQLLFDGPWPQVATTGTASDSVNQAESDLHGWGGQTEGAPWEFYAGLDHSEYDPVPYGHPKWNAYVNYVVAWSVMQVTTDLGPLDVVFYMGEKLVRADCQIGDVDGNELVDIMDILVAGMAFGAEDEGPGPDGTPDSPGEPYPDDKKDADLHYNAQADISDDRGLIDIMDILVMAMDFGKSLTPDCIVIP